MLTGPQPKLKIPGNVRRQSLLGNCANVLRHMARGKANFLRLATAPLRCLPNFVVIGCQRSGSSSLYEYLCRHSQILPAARKEVHYFDLRYAEGSWYYRSMFPLRFSRAFSGHGKSGGCITGEATPYYLPHPLVAERLADLLPDAKLIVIFRNPVDRAFSQYSTMVASGQEQHSFEEAIDLESARVDREVDRMLVEPSYYSWMHRRYSYLSRGHYAEQLNQWLEFFPRESFLFLQSERLFANANQTLARVCEFLGVPSFEIDRAERERAAKYGAQLEPQTRRRLEDYFAPHNQKLFALIGEEYDW